GCAAQVWHRRQAGDVRPAKTANYDPAAEVTGDTGPSKKVSSRPRKSRPFSLPEFGPLGGLAVSLEQLVMRREHGWGSAQT
ncbi:MAG: hypothetical protein WAN70_08415, partial [Terriglobales bacterium]